MLTIVLTINAILAFLCLVVVWQAWKLKGVLGQIADILTAVESTTHHALYDAPDVIEAGEKGVQLLQERIHHVEPQLRRLRRLLTLLYWGHRLWRRRTFWVPIARHLR